MSFLTRTSLRSTTRSIHLAAPRAFSTSIVNRKTVTDSVKDTLKTVDRAVADKLVDGIEVGQNAAHKAKSVAGMSADEAKGQAAEVAGEAKGKAHEVAGQAQGKASEVAGQAQGTVNKATGQAQGKMEEMKGKM